MELRESKVIISAKTAKHLLRLGFQIVDLKPDRNNTDRTMFIFRNSEELECELRKFTEQIA